MVCFRSFLVLIVLFATGCASVSEHEPGVESDPDIEVKSGLVSLNSGPGDDCALGCMWSGYAVALGAQKAEYLCAGIPCACVAQGDIYSSCQSDAGANFGGGAEEESTSGGAFQVAGFQCGTGCVWSTWAVVLGAQSAEANCAGQSCACVQEGNIWLQCSSSDAPVSRPSPTPPPAASTPAPSHSGGQVPYFYQYDNRLAPGATCQNTSIAMVLAHYGWSGKPDDITAEFGRRRAQNPAGLSEVFNTLARRAGLSPRSTPHTNGSLAGMRAELDRGRPVIVHGYFTGSGHVIVVTGYDAGGYYVNDPAGKWSETFRGGYPYGGGSWSGADLYYGRAAFEAAVATSNGYDYLAPWYHAIR